MSVDAMASESDGWTLSVSVLVDAMVSESDGSTLSVSGLVFIFSLR